MRITILVSLLFLLGACQQMQQARVAEAQQKENAAIAACKNGEELSKNNAIRWVDCFGSAWLQFTADVGANNNWIVLQNIAANRSAAVAYTEGKITREEFLTATKKNFADGAQTDAALRGQQQQQNSQNLIALQGMIPKPQPMPQPYMMPVNKSTQTNCTGGLNSINCTSY